MRAPLGNAALTLNLSLGAEWFATDWRLELDAPLVGEARNQRVPLHDRRRVTCRSSGRRCALAYPRGARAQTQSMQSTVVVCISRPSKLADTSSLFLPSLSLSLSLFPSQSISADPPSLSLVLVASERVLVTQSLCCSRAHLCARECR